MCPLCEDDGWEQIGDSHIVADRADIVPGEPSDIIDEEDASVIQPGEGMPEPYVPTSAQVAQHNLTHLPYRSWCKWCVMARRPNSQHRSKHPSFQRNTPLLVADYCQIRDSREEDLATVLVARLYPAKAILGVVCDNKGVDEMVIARLASFIKDSGYSKIVYKSDQERALRAMLEESFRRSGRTGECYNPTLQQFVPEASAVGESQSNGKAENAVQRLEDMVRTYKAALEDHIGSRIPSRHPVIRWIVEHAACTYNRHVCNSDGVTPYEAIHGQRSRGKLVEFGEQVFYYVPKRLRAKLNLRFRIGTFLGNSQSTNEAYVAIKNGSVIKSRSIVRVVKPSRWSREALTSVCGIPGRLTPQGPEELDAAIEEHADPHAHADESLGADDDAGAETLDDADMVKLDRQLRLTVKDFKQFGWTEKCPRCLDLQAGAHRTTTNHSGNCRLRMYLAFKDANTAKWRAVRHLIDPEPDAPFNQRHVDMEGASGLEAPRALDGQDIFDHSVRHEPNVGQSSAAMDDVDEEQKQSRDAADVVIANEAFHDPFHDPFGNVYEDSSNEMDVAEIFGDFDNDDNADSMAMALTASGLNTEHARQVAFSMCQHEPTSSFIEVYGRSIRDQSLVTRRDFNIQGLDAFDLRTLKPNGQPWNFLQKDDRRLAKRIIDEKNPDWILGAPPCTPFSIWNYAMNYPKMDPAKVQALIDDGRVHLNFMCSLYRRQMAKGIFSSTSIQRQLYHGRKTKLMHWPGTLIAM